MSIVRHMGYRDDDAVLRERIDQLELRLAKAAGQVMLLADERDVLRDELERLTRDPNALARVRRSNQARSGLFQVMRVLGGIAVGLVALPMIVLVLALGVQGDFGAAVFCSVLPALLILGTMALKLPEIVAALELRFERKQRDKRAAELATRPARVRVAADAAEPEYVEQPARATARHER